MVTNQLCMLMHLVVLILCIDSLGIIVRVHKLGSYRGKG